MRTNVLLTVFVALTAHMAAGVMFSADVRVEVTNGYYLAKYYYRYGEAGKNNAARFEYSTPTKMIDLIDYTEGRRYKYCTSCESGFYMSNAPLLFPVANENATGIRDGNCVQYVRAAGQDSVDKIWYDSNKKICKAELTDGKTLVFSNVDTTFKDHTKFNMTGAECPAPVCKRVMDLVFVLDTSFSICHEWNEDQNQCDLSDWRQIQDFAKTIVNSFDIGNDATMVGIVTFCKQATKQLELSASKDDIIKAINSVSKMCASTCIGCGVEGAINLLKKTSATRNARNPEKMIIFMTDGGNNVPWDNERYCSKYEPVCVNTSSVCKSYKCAKYECLDYDTSKCAKYRCNQYSTTECAECKRCVTYSVECKTRGDKCVKNSTICNKCSSTNGKGDDCCQLNYWGTCSAKSGGGFPWDQGNNCNGAQCACTGYQCAEYNCEEYKCLDKTCVDCAEYKCNQYSTDCEEYECKTSGDTCVKETCNEYECLEYKLQCTEYGRGYEGHLDGILSKLHSGYALGGTSKDILTVAIGVGSDIEPDEVKAVASTMEGMQLYYPLKDFSALAGIISGLVQETCTLGDEDLELCSSNCHGFCGCEKKCYCPTCNAGDYCTKYECNVYKNNTESGGCEANETKCSESLCVDVTRDPKHPGCCKETERDCSKEVGNRCYQASCTPELGCYLTPIDPTPDDGCSVGDYCDNYTGWHYKSPCKTVGLCNHTICTPDGATGYKCTYPPVCPQTDPCNVSTCNDETGQCTYEPIVCTPGTPCNISVCVEGVCVEKVNAELYNECRNKANNSCEVGYCNITTGQCEIEDISVKNPSCGVCDIKPPNCTEFTHDNPCLIYECGIDETTNGTYCKFVKDECPKSTDPCKIHTCDLSRKDHCDVKDVDCTIDKCHIGRCVPDPDDPTQPHCEQEPVCKSDVCYNRTCDMETGECSRVPLCPHKPCHTFDHCNVLANGTADCHYVPKPRKADTTCSYTYCDEEKDDWVEVDNSSNCFGDDPCVIYNCYPVTGCSAKPVSCDDNNKCTIDYCMPRNDTSSSSSAFGDDQPRYQCVHEPKCTTDKFCERVSCSMVSGECSYTDYICDDYPGKDETELDSCHTAQMRRGVPLLQGRPPPFCLPRRLWLLQSQLPRLPA